MEDLTKNQRMFCNEYLIDLNATRAYKAAYQNVTKDETAAAASSRLLRNVKIKAYIDKRMKEREIRTGITQDRVLSELGKIGFADISDYLEYRTEQTIVEYIDGKPVFDYKLVVEMKDSTKVDTSAIQELTVSKDGTFKFKLYDKQKSLEDIIKHLGMFESKELNNAQIDKLQAQTRAIEGLGKEIEDTSKLRELIGWNDSK